MIFIDMYPKSAIKRRWLGGSFQNHIARISLQNLSRRHIKINTGLEVHVQTFLL